VGHGGFGHWLVDMQALLAEALGIEVEELEAAQQAANEAAIQQLLDQGQLTAEQAELASAANRLKSYLDREAFVAEALGISVADLEAAVAEGQTLSDLLDEQGLDSATYRENLAAAEQAAIAQAVEDGVITQEQADQLQDFGPGRFGFGSGRGGFRRGGFFAPGLPDRAPEDTLNG
jgi:lambda repressor-like predicted transcriptional regulator